MISDRVQNIIIKLIIFSIPVVAVYYTLKNLPKDRVVLDDVSLKDIEAKEDNKGMAIMLGDKLGNYSASQESGFPSNLIYKYNSEKSGCIDVNGIIVDGILSYDDASSTASLNTGMTVSCYLYFDMDKEAPTNSSISINNGDIYTNNVSTTLTLSSTGASHMCISEDNNSCINYVDYNTSYNYTLSNGDGTKTVYVIYKDYADNISEVASDSIILDTTAPVINSISDAGDGKISYTVTENLSGVSHYCAQTTNTSSGCKWVSIANGNQTTGIVTEEDGTFYLFLKDNAGNISSSQSVSLSVGIKFGEYLLQDALSGKTAYSGLYRYTGTSANNYVDLGGVLYRIIGVTDGSTTNTDLGLTANQVKLIKATSGGNEQWYTDYVTDVRWNVSGYTVTPIYTLLQGNTILESSTVIPSVWTSKISSVKWYVGDVQDDEENVYNEVANGSTIFGYEDNIKTQSTTKVGLMYLSDWYYAYNEGGTQNCYNSPYCVSWMTDGTDIYEWTMSRYGGYGSKGLYDAWGVGNSGYVSRDYLNSAYAVRPVIYLNADVVYIEIGDGSSGSPYQIS